MSSGQPRPLVFAFASPLLPDKGLRLGLDLQGGIHWVLGVKLEEAEAQELGFLADNLREVGGKDGVHGPGARTDPAEAAVE